MFAYNLFAFSLLPFDTPPPFPRPFVNLAETSSKPNGEARWMSTFRINCMSIAKAVAVRLRRTLIDWWMDWLTDALTVEPFDWPSVVASFRLKWFFREFFLSACQSLPGLTFHLSQLRVNSQLLHKLSCHSKNTQSHRQYIYTHIHTYICSIGYREQQLSTHANWRLLLQFELVKL